MFSMAFVVASLAVAFTANVGSAWAFPGSVEPARSSTSRSRPTSISLANYAQLMTSSATTGPGYYGAPYKDDYIYHNDGYSQSVDEALNKWWAQYQKDWKSVFPGCSYTATYDSAGPKTGHFASFSLHGKCGGGGNIYGTFHPLTYSLAAPGGRPGNGGCDCEH